MEALDEYVHREDGAWTYNILDTYRYRDVSVVMVNMTSQRWLDGKAIEHTSLLFKQSRCWTFKMINVSMAQCGLCSMPEADIMVEADGSNSVAVE